MLDNGIRLCLIVKSAWGRVLFSWVIPAHRVRYLLLPHTFETAGLEPRSGGMAGGATPESSSEPQKIVNEAPAVIAFCETRTALVFGAS